jgi:hypothetical protein
VGRGGLVRCLLEVAAIVVAKATTLQGFRDRDLRSQIPVLRSRYRVAR